MDDYRVRILENVVNYLLGVIDAIARDEVREIAHETVRNSFSGIDGWEVGNGAR